MFATLIQERLDARAEYQQGEEQARLRERLKGFPVADFIREEIEIDRRFILEKLVSAQLNWWYDNILTDKDFHSKVAESLEYYLGKESFNKLHKELIERAIDNQYEITKGR